MTFFQDGNFPKKVAFILRNVPKSLFLPNNCWLSVLGVIWWICWGGYGPLSFLCRKKWSRKQKSPPFKAVKTAKEMTLDCLFFSNSFSVKGHFCSFLLSNIIGYLAFLNLDFFTFLSYIISCLIFKNQFALTSSIETPWFLLASQIWFDMDQKVCPVDSGCCGIFSDP